MMMAFGGFVTQTTSVYSLVAAVLCGMCAWFLSGMCVPLALTLKNSAFLPRSMFMYFFHLIFHKKLIVSFILVSPLL
jgi:hypothetical protein